MIPFGGRGLRGEWAPAFINECHVLPTETTQSSLASYIIRGQRRDMVTPADLEVGTYQIPKLPTSFSTILWPLELWQNKYPLFIIHPAFETVFEIFSWLFETQRWGKEGEGEEGSKVEKENIFHPLVHRPDGCMPQQPRLARLKPRAGKLLWL